MTIDDLTRWLGIVGGITGPLGLIVAYLTYRRDNGRLRVRVRRQQRITQGPDNPAIRAMLKHYESIGEDPPMDLYVRDPDKTWAIIEVTNVGRRKLRLQQIGWKVINAKLGIPSGFFGYSGSAPWIPCDLDEGEARDFPVEEEQLVNAGYAYARISTGTSFYGGFSPGLRGFWYRITTRLALLNGR